MSKPVNASVSGSEHMGESPKTSPANQRRHGVIFYISRAIKHILPLFPHLAAIATDSRAGSRPPASSLPALWSLPDGAPCSLLLQLRWVPAMLGSAELSACCSCCIAWAPLQEISRFFARHRTRAHLQGHLLTLCKCNLP